MVPEKPTTDRQTQGTPGTRSTSSGRNGCGWRFCCHHSTEPLPIASASKVALAVDSTPKRWPTRLSQSSALAAKVANSSTPAGS
jgi:hypothetical protein